MVVKTRANFYDSVCGNRKMLEGNIMEHAPFIMEIVKRVKPGDRVRCGDFEWEW